MRRIGFVCATTIGLLTLASPASGQPRVFVTPFVGGFIPTAPLGQLRIAGLTQQPFTFTGEMQAGVGFGGRLDVWAAERWGITGSYFRASSEFRATTGPFSASADGTVQGGTLAGFFQATSEGTGTDIVLKGGLSGVHHGGRAFQLAADQFDVGGVLGAGLHVLLSTQVTFRIDGDLLIYRWSAGPSFPTATQTDLLMTVGLGLRLGR